MKFLVIDDEPLVRRSLVRALTTRGYDSLEAVDGPEGLRIWGEARPDAVFVDVLMPGLSGPDVVRQALSQNRVQNRTSTEFPEDRPVIALISAFSGEDSEKLAIECGADCFIAKPFDDIFAVVDRVAGLVLERRRKKGT